MDPSCRRPDINSIRSPNIIYGNVVYQIIYQTMLRATPTLQKMASTHGGMRRILKKRLPVQRYIELAVKAGSYKSPSTRPNYLGLHDVPDPKKGVNLSPREREERLKLQRGIIDYPTEVRRNSVCVYIL